MTSIAAAQARPARPSPRDELQEELRSKIASGITVTWNPSGTMEVRVRYAGYGQSPLLPVLTLPGIGAIPNLPDDLVGTATLRPN